MLVGGGPVDPDLKDRARSAGIRLVATYGMAETCGGCVYDGLPLDGVGLALGTQGRVKLAGPTLFDGYLDDPAATDEVLVDGWFHTSDAGRLDEDGRLRVLGRIDDMVISGGVNVPAAAVAARLREHPRVTAAEVVGLTDAEWGHRVVAVVVGDLALAEAREWVGEKHPRAWAPRECGRRTRAADARQRQGGPARRSRAGGGRPMRVFSIPMTTRFRGIAVREGALIEGESGWGEWSPFTEYSPEVAEPWLRCAEEAAAGAWPAPRTRPRAGQRHGPGRPARGGPRPRAPVGLRDGQGEGGRPGHRAGR